MEMRLIDADAITYCNYDLDSYLSFRAVDEDEIADMPTIDAVQVVHCKDCIHLTRSPWNRADFGWCKLYGHNRKMDYYCASGEVTENE